MNTSPVYKGISRGNFIEMLDKKKKKKRNRSFPIIARCAGLSFKSPSQASDTFDLYILDKSDQPWGPRIDSRKPTFAFRKTSPKPRFPCPTIHRYIRSPPVTKVAGPFIRARSTTDLVVEEGRTTKHYSVESCKKTLSTIPTSWTVSRWRGGPSGNQDDRYLGSVPCPSLSLSLSFALFSHYLTFLFSLLFSSSFMLEEFLLFTSS